MESIKDKKGKISASMMCSDLIDLKETIRIFEDQGIEYLHIDMMDGNFFNCIAAWTGLIGADDCVIHEFTVAHKIRLLSVFSSPVPHYMPVFPSMSL